VRDAVAEMGRRRMEQQLQVAQHMLEVQRQEMEELKKLKKEWQRTSSNEYAPDGTRLGQVTFSLCVSLSLRVCVRVCLWLTVSLSGCPSLSLSASLRTCRTLRTQQTTIT
jgi:hypothetical protein